MKPSESFPILKPFAEVPLGRVFKGSNGILYLRGCTPGELNTSRGAREVGIRFTDGIVVDFPDNPEVQLMCADLIVEPDHAPRKDQ